LDDVTVEKIGGVPQSLLETEQSQVISHHVYGFVGFDGTTDELKLPTYNIWSLPTGPGVSDPSDIAASWNQLFGSARGELPAFLASDEAAKKAQVPCFISFPSAKDTTYEERNPGKSVAVLITESDADFFGKVGPHNKRGEEYATIKKRYEHVLLNSLYHYFPQLKGKATYVDVGTPFSNEFYLERKSSYGLNHTSARLLDATLRITVPGLSGFFLTGQDVLCDGVFPQVITAWMTLAKVVGITSPDFWLLFSNFAASVGRRCLFDRTYQSKNP
jgi:all-trans-retinol 13,14-reductase